MSSEADNGATSNPQRGPEEQDGFAASADRGLDTGAARLTDEGWTPAAETGQGHTAPVVAAPSGSGEAGGDLGGGRRLIVWRHGETTYNASGRWQGQYDAPLSDRGRQQARQAAEYLAALGATRVVASDLSRAAETGRALAEAAGIPITYDDRLREINVGEWAGLTTEQIRSQYGEVLDQVEQGADVRRGVTGETLSELAARARAAARDVVETMAPGETVVLACHGVAARTLSAAMTGIPQHVAWVSLQGMTNCHWSVLRQRGDSWQLAGWNVGR